MLTAMEWIRRDDWPLIELLDDTSIPARPDRFDRQEIEAHRSGEFETESSSTEE